MPTSTRFLVDPSERLIDEACPVCGDRLLEFDIPFMGNTVTVSDCPSCMRRREAEEKVERDSRALHASRMREAGVPATLAGVKPDDSFLPHLVAGGSVWLAGERAVSKACAMLASWVDAGRSALYTTDYAVYHMDAAAVERCFNAGLVLVDGVGKSNPGLWGGSRLCAILDSRQKSGKPTIVASIMTPASAVSNISATDPAAASGIKAVVKGWQGVKA